MSSRNNGGKSSFKAAAGGGYSTKGKSVAGSDLQPNIEQLNHNMSNVDVDSKQDGAWEVMGKKSKYQPGGAAGKMTGSSTPAPKSWAQPKQTFGTNGGGRAQPPNNTGSVKAAWGQPPDFQRPAAGRGYRAPLPPPLQKGWQWGARSSSFSQTKVEDNISVDGYDDESNIGDNQSNNEDVSDDDDELLEDSEDDLSDDYDSDASQKSHETRKASKWFKAFFEALDKLSLDEISEPTREWHCPACQKGPGAIDWYTGIQPLVTHAKTKGANRAQLHRELAKLLDEELRRRGTSVIPAGEAFGKWRGLRETTTDHEIVWPPMVVVMNTLLEKEDNDKWIGMGNQELLEYFSTYKAVKARHSYGPQGHRGMSLLIFEATAMGYHEAERLHKHFSEQGTCRDAWERRRVLFYPGGKRQLYGYLAGKEDMETFNHHCHGKSRLKYEMKSYQEMVVIPMKQMSEDNQQLVWLKNKVVKTERRSKALEETFGVVSQKLRETMEENRIVRHRTKMQYEENKEEMDCQEQFFKEQMGRIQKDTEEKEGEYEILLQQERAKAKKSLRKEEIQRFIDTQVKGVKEFEAVRERLIREHDEKKVELKRKYMEEEVELEKAFDIALTKLMEMYTPTSFESSTSS